MSPLMVLLLLGGGYVAVKALSSDEPRAPVFKRAKVLDPIRITSSTLALATTPLAKIPIVAPNATPEEMKAAFAAAADRSTAQREAQFKASRTYASNQMNEWGKYVPILGSLAGAIASALTWGAATVGNAVADFLGLYDNDWNSDANQIRAQNDVQKVLQLGLIPDPFSGDLHAGAVGYAEDLEANTLNPIQALGGDFNSRWRSFIAWYTADVYRPVILDASLIRDANGNPFFPSTLRGLTSSRASVMVLGRLVSSFRGRDPSLGMIATAKVYDAWSREDRMFNDRAAKRLAAVFDAAWSA